MGGAVTEGVLESNHDLPAVVDREAFVGDGRAGDVAAQAFEGVPVTGLACRVMISLVDDVLFFHA